MGSTLGADDVHDIGVSAYIYLYSLVTMDITRLQCINGDPTRKPNAGPTNQFVHLREFPKADFKVVVRPNFDTLYSSAWLDLTDGPMVVSAGAVSDGRYYQLPMYDMWTDAFAAPGQRTSGSDPGHWAVVPPRWSGTLPEGVERIDAPTPYVWIIGRTQTNGPSDYPAVHQIQDQYAITPLRTWPENAPVAPAVIDMSVDTETAPLDAINAMAASEYFDYALELLELHRPHLTDWSLLAQMARAGLVPGAKFADLAPVSRTALASAATDGQAELARAFPTLANVVRGWQMNIDTMGVYGNFYTKRALVTMVGLGANAAEDAIYPVLMADGDGNPVSGDHRYVLHFERNGLPPVNAFWSVTMYDDQGFQVANELSRFAIGDRDDLAYNEDGSLDLYIQHQSPGPERESNWLPAPRGPLGVTMRMYSPKPAALTGAWSPPAMVKVT